MAVPTVIGAGALVASSPGAVPQTHANTLTGDLVLVFMLTANEAFPTFPQTGSAMTAYAAPNQPTGFGTP